MTNIIYECSKINVSWIWKGENMPYLFHKKESSLDVPAFKIFVEEYGESPEKISRNFKI
jgi:hypothetical protein